VAFYEADKVLSKKILGDELSRAAIPVTKMRRIK
jgi:hypothetical protein